MCDKKIEILTPIIKTCGEKAQIIQAIEELSELQKALCKYLKEDTYENRENIEEEMADVQIMLDQLMIIFDNEKQIQTWTARKITRTYQRLGIETKEA